MKTLAIIMIVLPVILILLSLYEIVIRRKYSFIFVTFMVVILLIFSIRIYKDCETFGIFSEEEALREKYEFEHFLIEEISGGQTPQYKYDRETNTVKLVPNNDKYSKEEMDLLLEYLKGIKTNQNLQQSTEDEQKSEESKTYTQDEVNKIVSEVLNNLNTE